MIDDPKKLAERFKPKQVKVVQPDRQMNMVRFSRCGKLLAAACLDGTIRRWDFSTEQFAELPPLKGHGGWVQALAFHPDAKRLLAVDSWGALHCWDAEAREAAALWKQETAHDGWIRGLDLSVDGKLVATCGRDRKVCLWSAGDGKKVREFSGHDEDVLCVAFDAEGKSVVSGDLRGSVRHWDIETGKLQREFDAKVLYLQSRLQDVGGARCLRFNAGGTLLAIAGTRPSVGANVQGVPTILFFDWSSGQLRHTLKIGGEGDGFITDLSFHPAGFVLATTSGNPGTGKLFFQRPEDREPFFQAAIPNVHSLAVHPSGKRLVVAATNAGSNGNGRQLGPNKEYQGNFSPLHVWDLPG